VTHILRRSRWYLFRLQPVNKRTGKGRLAEPPCRDNPDPEVLGSRQSIEIGENV